MQEELKLSSSESGIKIEDAAKRLGVSSATIRNWIKARDLKTHSKSLITLDSMEKLEKEIKANEKLSHRANKSFKDTHDHALVTSDFMEKINNPNTDYDQIGFNYESSLSNSYRNKEGIYYTPTDIIKDLLNIPSDKIGDSTFCDPCCGSGNFIIRALEIGFKPENIYGFDIDPIAVEITKKRIFEHSKYNSENIKTADFLSLTTSKNTIKYDYIYTNPPWGKKISSEDKEKYVTKFKSGLSKDTCSLFFFASLESLNDNGELGLLLPESFFNISTFESARIKALELSITKLIDYGKAFKGLVTNAQAIILKKSLPQKDNLILCKNTNNFFYRKNESFSKNPKSIINLYCNQNDSETINHLFSIEHINLLNNAEWALGIVTGNNKKFLSSNLKDNHIPVYKGSDISKSSIKNPTNFIPENFNLYQQVAPIKFFKAKEKLIYKFISKRLCFFYDNKQRFVLNSANIIIPKENFPIPTKLLGELLSSDYMNWLFSKIYNTHKILRSDIESLPIHSQFLEGETSFKEDDYLNKINLTRTSCGTYRVKK